VIDLRHWWIVQQKEMVSQLVYGEIMILNPFINVVGEDLKLQTNAKFGHEKKHWLCVFFSIFTCIGLSSSL
jgi:hypothetical protein